MHWKISKKECLSLLFFKPQKTIPCHTHQRVLLIATGINTVIIINTAWGKSGKNLCSADISDCSMWQPGIDSIFCPESLLVAFTFSVVVVDYQHHNYPKFPVAHLKIIILMVIHYHNSANTLSYICQCQLKQKHVLLNQMENKKVWFRSVKWFCEINK